jgi:hypothetical protein
VWCTNEKDEVKLAIDAIQADEKCWELQECWECDVVRVPLLYAFFGGLATVFLGTSTVESDFSELKSTKDEYSVSLSDFSLEEKLSSRQFDLVQGL